MLTKKDHHVPLPVERHHEGRVRRPLDRCQHGLGDRAEPVFLLRPDRLHADRVHRPQPGRWHAVEGDLDFRGTLGVDKEAPVGFREIRLTFDVDTDVPQDKLDQLLKLTERYCVVYQTIAKGPPVDIKLQRV